jgi:hypothetical protein
VLIHGCLGDHHTFGGLGDTLSRGRHLVMHQSRMSSLALTLPALAVVCRVMQIFGESISDHHALGAELTEQHAPTRHECNKHCKLSDATPERLAFRWRPFAEPMVLIPIGIDIEGRWQHRDYPC